MSASIRLRLADFYVRKFVKREHWGEPDRLARRARRIFGSPRIWSGASSIGLRVTEIKSASVAGELIEPPCPLRGAIFYVHGGGYVACSARTHRPLTAALARLTRRRVFSLDYRLAPEHRFPAAFDDTRRGYEWFLREMGEDARHTAVAGDSAGGGLALALMVAARDAGIVLPACCVLFSPWMDMEGLIEGPHPNAERCAMFHPANIDEFAEAYLGGAPRSDPRASPSLSELQGLPPILLQVGETELLVEDSRKVHERIMAGGGISELETWPAVFHGWQMLHGLVPEGRQAVERATSFMVRHLDGSLARPNAGGAMRSVANITESTITPLA